MPIRGAKEAGLRMKKRAKNLRGGKLYEKIGNILSTSVKKNVESGGRPKWRPRKYKYSHPILDKTGTMRDTAEISAMHWRHGPRLHVNEILGPEYGLVHQYTGVKTKFGSRTEHVVRKYIVIQRGENEAIHKAFGDVFHKP